MLACLAQFMVILDVSVVNVALPSIRHALHFSESGLQWVVNAYTVTFAGFLLLGGRAADLLGRRRVFVWGLVIFGLASLGGGFSDSRTMLIVMRLAQGFGGAVIAPASLAILTTTFTEPKERNRAVGIWSAMGGAGGAAGILAGGLLTQLLGWRWILFVNVPIGLVAAVLSQRLLLDGRNPHAQRSFDLFGALAATVGLSLLVFGIVRTDTTGWGSGLTLAAIIGGVAIVGLFVLIEARFASAPLMPLRLFSSRSLSAANVAVMLTGASTFPMWFFFTLYLQEVRHYSPIHAGVIFLPMTIMIIIGSNAASRLAFRFGPRLVVAVGMAMVAVGLYLFSLVGIGSTYLGSMLIPGVLAGLGMAIALVPSVIAATSGVAPREAGVASGLANTARLFGGALGLAILATLASTRTAHDLRHHTFVADALNRSLVDGFQFAFVFCAIVAAVGAVVAVTLMPATIRRAAAPEAAPDGAALAAVEV
jgi:EmrB/QacA subfamily drug resistance transporter